MTEQQIAQFKSILDDSSLVSDLEKSSKDLDMKILSASRERETRKIKASKLAMFGLSINVLGTACLAVLFTVGLFFGMSHLIAPDELPIVFKDQPEVKVEGLVISEAPVKNLVVRPELVTRQDAPSKVSRDKILMDFSLPATSKLLAKMEFGVAQDREEAQAAINIAMFEINTMIELGTFDSARERYAMLLENCQACSLPTTLEALVLSMVPRTG